MLSINNNLRQVCFCGLLGLAPVAHTQANDQSRPVVYQQIPVSLASPQPNNLTNGLERLSSRNPAAKDSKGKKFTCSRKGCGETFRFDAARCLHERSIHLITKNYKCHICKKRFTQKAGLKRHANVHSGVKPYLCLICVKSFSQSSNLFTHIKNCHQIQPVNHDNWVKIEEHG